KRGREYAGIDHVAFSPASSKLAYAGSNGGRTFIILNDQEQEQTFDSGTRIVFSRDGKRVAYMGLRIEGGKHQRVIVVDDKVFVGDHLTQTEGFAFSPEGSRFAWPGSSGLSSGVWVDG